MRFNPTDSTVATTQLSFIQRRLHIDPTLLTPLLLLAVFGLIVLYSAFGAQIDQIDKQVVRLGIAFGVLFAVAQIPPRQLRRWAPWFYGLSLLLLFSVLLFGVAGGGAKRWLDLGVVRFQPSEMMKLALPMMLSAFLGARDLPPHWGRLAISLLLIVVPAGVIAIEPDLGTALLVTLSGLSVLFLVGLAWWVILTMIITMAASAPPLWFLLLHDYQRERVLTFLDPTRDPLGTGYHVIQSKIAIGSGGLYGKGWLNGSQAHLSFLPEQHTDFVFAVLAEEFGFIGVILLLVLYFMVIARGLHIASHAQDNYGRLLAGSIVLTFFIYFFVNIGMVSGLLPVVGLPLPLISYGGTSIVTLLAAFGMLMSIHTHRRLWVS
ncbi:rod shape-determining protein RodA [Nitrococcus mobilis Nb-231]|uniref:Peptidoglycan glycosyltransferase MrdB n=1 Tax=Nitrococcus mobilis Nb-231 TaxID=314278 RepID=A4BLX2_9GAMM|nr:rod shape-determining protein RodA [Nitrococcus mobilis Nb-231]